MGEVYKITNLVNGKVYIGSSTQSGQVRMDYHMAKIGDAAGPFYSEIDKYGKRNFQLSIICKVEDENDLRELEYELIREHIEVLGRDQVYNVATHVDYWRDRSHDPDVVAKRMETMRRRYGILPINDPKYREKAIQSQIDKYGSLAFHTPEARAKSNEASQTDEAKAKRVATQVERYGSLGFHTPEARKKSIEMASKPEVQRRRVATDKARHGGRLAAHSPEAIEKNKRTRSNIVEYKGIEYAGLADLRKALREDGYEVPATTLNRMVQYNRFPEKYKELEGKFKLVRLGVITKLAKNKK
ncbi:homing endonuclease [Bacillus phage SP-15]|uniref:Homing endonuclease n=1 Tax=Bacillus phage SP-15 TaxID=1792032 RepID=A0A127AWD2_9CAUD|nr:homing endonuclease [Bacillus phage SP-15]AMM45016.1 homing endonuclease [Bacillus phage SP-15]